MWWWNGWYSYNVQMYYGYKWTYTAFDTTTVGTPFEAGLKFGLWCDVSFFLKNEFADWYWLNFWFKGNAFDVEPAQVYVQLPLEVAGAHWNTFEYCIRVYWYLQLLSYKTRINQNARVCQQSLLKLYDSNEFEPICDYDENNEAEFWDDFLIYDLFNDWIIPDIIDTADQADWTDIFGSHSYFGGANGYCYDLPGS